MGMTVLSCTLASATGVSRRPLLHVPDECLKCELYNLQAQGSDEDPGSAAASSGSHQSALLAAANAVKVAIQQPTGRILIGMISCEMSS